MLYEVIPITVGPIFHLVMLQSCTDQIPADTVRTRLETRPYKNLQEFLVSVVEKLVSI